MTDFKMNDIVLIKHNAVGHMANYRGKRATVIAVNGKPHPITYTVMPDVPGACCGYVYSSEIEPISGPTITRLETLRKTAAIAQMEKDRAEFAHERARDTYERCKREFHVALQAYQDAIEADLREEAKRRKDGHVD